jgi:hypothetical protein
VFQSVFHITSVHELTVAPFTVKAPQKVTGVTEKIQRRSLFLRVFALRSDHFPELAAGLFSPREDAFRGTPKLTFQHPPLASRGDLRYT